MYKDYILLGLMVFFLIDNGSALKCYTCYGKPCLHVNNDTEIVSCDNNLDNASTKNSNENVSLFENATETFCIHVRYRLIADIEQADRFCSNEPCSVVETRPIYKIGSKCEQCKTDLCNSNLGVNIQSWSLPILVVFTIIKLVF